VDDALISNEFAIKIAIFETKRKTLSTFILGNLLTRDHVLKITCNSELKEIKRKSVILKT
jgi:hypothetical protein